MKNTKKEVTVDFCSEFERFIRESKSGKRLQPNGKRICPGTISTYRCTLNLVLKYSEKEKIALRFKPVRRLNTQELLRERNYWNRFYRHFSNYLFEDRGFYDNYVGLTFKNIRTFIAYLNKDRMLGLGEFYKQFYIRKEEIAIFPLLPEELNFLIHDSGFTAGLSNRMKEVKDFFVFGCTVGLRFSDLISLRKSNIRKVNEQQYLVVRSKKTDTDSLIKLPQYAIDIIARYNNHQAKLLPGFNRTNLNLYIKLLLEKAGFTHPVQISRSKRGRPGNYKLKSAHGYSARFCDVASTHTMRRTAITTMLTMGIPETIVRKISGHAANSRDFYRYVFWAQQAQDELIEKMFEKLENRKLNTTHEQN